MKKLTFIFLFFIFSTSPLSMHVYTTKANTYEELYKKVDYFLNNASGKTLLVFDIDNVLLDQTEPYLLAKAIDKILKKQSIPTQEKNKYTSDLTIYQEQKLTDKRFPTAISQWLKRKQTRAICLTDSTVGEWESFLNNRINVLRKNKIYLGERFPYPYFDILYYDHCAYPINNSTPKLLSITDIIEDPSPYVVFKAGVLATNKYRIQHKNTYVTIKAQALLTFISHVYETTSWKPDNILVIDDQYDINLKPIKKELLKTNFNVLLLYFPPIKEKMNKEILRYEKEAIYQKQWEKKARKILKKIKIN
jgi:hypothetical protein